MALVFLLCGGAAVARGEPRGAARACDPEVARLLAEEPVRVAAWLAERRAEGPLSGACRVVAAWAELVAGKEHFAVRSALAARTQLLARYRESHPLVREAQLVLCVALAQTGQWESASEECAAVTESSAAAYYGGISAFRSGDDRQAISLLSRGDVAALGADFEGSAARFLTLAFGRLAGVRPGARLLLGSRAGWDSNALMAPDDPALVGIDGEVAAISSAHWASVVATPANWGRTALAVQGDVNRTCHYATPADSVNATTLGGSVGVQRHGLLGKGRHALEARYGVRVTWLDGGPATLEDHLFGFVEAHSLSLGPSFWDARGNGYSLRYALSVQRFAELVRNGTSHTLSAGEEFYLGETLSLAVAQSGSFTDTGTAYRRWASSLGTFLTWQPFSRLAMTVRGTVQYEDYFASEGYFSDTVTRRDWSHVVHGDVTWELGDGFSAGPYGGLSGRRSSVTSLSYDKWEAGLLVQWSGPLKGE